MHAGQAIEPVRQKGNLFYAPEIRLATRNKAGLGQAGEFMQRRLRRTYALVRRHVTNGDARRL